MYKIAAFTVAVLASAGAHADIYSMSDAVGNVRCILWDGKADYTPPDGMKLSADEKCVPHDVNPPPRVTTISRSEFLRRFTQAELIAISAAARANDQINVWIITAQAADQIDLSDSQTKQGLDALVAAKIITAERETLILGQ